jgi:hypothetical protein
MVNLRRALTEKRPQAIGICKACDVPWQRSYSGRTPLERSGTSSSPAPGADSSADHGEITSRATMKILVHLIVPAVSSVLRRRTSNIQHTACPCLLWPRDFSGPVRDRHRPLLEDCKPWCEELVAPDILTLRTSLWPVDQRTRWNKYLDTIRTIEALLVRYYVVAEFSRMIRRLVAMPLIWSGSTVAGWRDIYHTLTGKEL